MDGGAVAWSPASDRVERRVWLALVVAILASFMVALDSTVIVIAIPGMQAALGATSGQAELFLGAFTLAYAVGLITGGRLGDIYGRRRILLLGIGLFTLASLACGVAPSANALIGCRLLQGASGALMTPQVFSLIQTLVPPAQRDRAIGLWSTTVGVSVAAGPLLGGMILSADLAGLGWRPIFLMNLPVGLLALVGVARLLPESRAPEAYRLDLPGVGILSAGLLLIIIPLTDGQRQGWPLWTWVAFAAGLAMLAVFVRFERRLGVRGGAPLVDLRLFDDRAFAVGIALLFVSYTTLYSFDIVMALVLQDGLRLPAHTAGFVFFLGSVGFLLGSLVAPSLTARVGRRRLVAAGGLVWALSSGGIALAAGLSGAGLTATLVAPQFALGGIGFGLFLPPLVGLVLDGVRKEHVGTASGVLTTAQSLGGTLGIPLIGLVFFSALGDGRPGEVVPYASALTASASAVTVLILLALALLGLLPRRPRLILEEGPVAMADGGPPEG